LVFFNDRVSVFDMALQKIIKKLLLRNKIVTMATMGFHFLGTFMPNKILDKV